MVGFHAEAGLNLANCTVWSMSVCVTEFKSEILVGCARVMCLYLQFRGFLWAHMFACSQRERKHCARGEPACARVYSKVDYAFGSVLLTITKRFCFWREFQLKACTFTFAMQKICQY